jgi:hypothetical protein
MKNAMSNLRVPPTFIFPSQSLKYYLCKAPTPLQKDDWPQLFIVPMSAH